MKFLAPLIFLSLVLFLVLTRQSERAPASLGPNRIVLAEQKVSENSFLVLIGIECDRQKVSCEDWSKHGFESIKGDLLAVEPKYLVFKSKKYIEQVFSFEFGKISKNSMTTALEGEQERISHYLKLPNRIQAKLPALLIDTLYAKNRFRSASRIGLRILNMTPLVIFSRTIQEITKYRDGKKFFQASYLSRLIEMALIDENFPELIEVFGRENLKDLGASLRLRYRGSDSDIMTSIGIDETNRAEFYEEYVRLRTEVQSENMSKLVTRANEEGLLLIPYSRDLAMLFYDPQLEIDRDKYNDLLLNTKLVENVDRYRLITQGNNKLVPLGTFILTDKVAPKKIIDFEVPFDSLKKEKFINLIDYATDLGMGLFDVGGLGTAIRGGVSAGKLVLKKQGTIYGSANIES